MRVLAIYILFTTATAAPFAIYPRFAWNQMNKQFSNTTSGTTGYETSSFTIVTTDVDTSTFTTVTTDVDTTTFTFEEETTTYTEELTSTDDEITTYTQETSNTFTEGVPTSLVMK